MMQRSVGEGLLLTKTAEKHERSWPDYAAGAGLGWERGMMYMRPNTRLVFLSASSSRNLRNRLGRARQYHRTEKMADEDEDVSQTSRRGALHARMPPLPDPEMSR